jgi:hypothetical protein
MTSHRACARASARSNASIASSSAVSEKQSAIVADANIERSIEPRLITGCDMPLAQRSVRSRRVYMRRAIALRRRIGARRRPPRPMVRRTLTAARNLVC